LIEAERLTPLFVRGTLGELIKYVEITFILDLAHDAPLFQKIVCNLSTNRLPVSVEHNLKIFALG
jgi:hypothetical protein